MTQGVILFAYNSDAYNYYDMAEFTAKRANHFLNLPVTLVTDKESFPEHTDYVWDNVVFNEPDKDNVREWGTWINKGRYQAYEFSPYDETILLDVDYIINSDRLLKIFDVYDDFACHKTIDLLMYPDFPNDKIGPISHDVLWATVVGFRKSKRAEQIFNCLKMVQDNYEHYSNIHGFVAGSYRNDFALAVALRIANGHSVNERDFIPWNLTHIGRNIQVHQNTEDEFNTEYTLIFDNWQRNKIRKEWLTIRDHDFHVVNKDIAVELINE